jgi:4-amino-4-deoxy-L-arabinose transferase-like glycosyltransferase
MTDLAKPMTNQWRTNARQYIFLLVIVSGSACLLLANLGNQYLWEDEAQTALISKTILTDVVPRGYDGKNFFSQEKGAEYGKNYIWRWHTWLPFYVLAGFYKVFGVSTFVSRLPFVLFGVGTVLLTYIFARALWDNARIAGIAAGLLAISVPFLLLCRQCRYYSMTMFFTVLSLYAYTMLLERRKFAAILLFTGVTLLFHSQHFYVAVLFATVLLHSIIFRRDRLKNLLVVIGAIIVVNGPWLVWLAGMHYQGKIFSPTVLFIFIKAFSRDILRSVFPLWLLVIVLVVAVTRQVKTGHIFEDARLFWMKMSLPVFFVMFNVVLMLIIAPMPYFRYIAPSVPLLIILIAVIVNAAARVHLLLAVLAVALLVGTSRIRDYFYEITHDYDGPCEGISRYLNEHGSDNDVVAITYGDMVLKFYTNMRIIGGLTGENLEPAKNARWVIIRKYIHMSIDKEVRTYLLNNIDWSRYSRIKLDYPDTPWENRESPKSHLFRTSTNEDKVVIYERIK